MVARLLGRCKVSSLDHILRCSRVLVRGHGKDGLLLRPLRPVCFLATPSNIRRSAGIRVQLGPTKIWILAARKRRRKPGSNRVQ